MKHLAVVTLLLFPLMAIAEDQELAALFKNHKTNGTIILTSLDGISTFVHNDKRANKRFSTASTFKILNSLIALEEGLVSTAESVIKWDGTQYEYELWNKNQTLKSAFQVSCVWCYQKLARKVGSEKYRDYISSVSYGRLLDEFNETTFWLDNGLTISAVEQINFLKKVYSHSISFSSSSYETLREIMVVEESPSYTLRAKTGWAARVTPQVGWYVGYVEVKDNVWFFATNIEISSSKDLVLRKEITESALRIKGIIKDA